MVSGFLLSALAIGYLLVLFGVAFYGERRSVYPGHARLRPWIYSLALGVYCTTWTFFGAVGTAVRDGWTYVPIYLGPALVLLFGMPFLQRLVAIVRAHNITSIADLISSRFGKSPTLAALTDRVCIRRRLRHAAPRRSSRHCHDATRHTRARTPCRFLHDDGARRRSHLLPAAAIPRWYRRMRRSTGPALFWRWVRI